MLLYERYWCYAVFHLGLRSPVSGDTAWHEPAELGSAICTRALLLQQWGSRSAIWSYHPFTLRVLLCGCQMFTLLPQTSSPPAPGLTGQICRRCAAGKKSSSGGCRKRERFRGVVHKCFALSGNPIDTKVSNFLGSTLLTSFIQGTCRISCYFACSQVLWHRQTSCITRQAPIQPKI